MSRRRADESAQNLLEGTSGDSTSQPAFAASYTLILVACGVAGLAWKILSSSSTLPFPDAILALACISWFTAFLRVIRSPAALPATRLLSIVLVLWVPFGTAAFVYWLLRVRELER